MSERSESVLSMMKDQWESMAGMAGMFIVTIGIGIFIQPFFDYFPEAKAFGEEGTTKTEFILMELIMIGIFTVAIIWLARKGLDYIIKAIVMFALGLSMFYAILPFTYIPLMMGIEYGPLITWFAFPITFVAMYALHRYPEWWVVNSVGVMVGSGVIVMIGISFVPTLVIIFMILAAIYDYWAVHKSKHMLELADTMIGLKLPVLLVSPKEKGYSFLEQEGDIMQNSPPPPPERLETEIVDEEKRIMSKKKSRDALFMGLGDVIFPGMLVISALTFLPEWGGEVWSPFGNLYEDSTSFYLAQLLVAIGTLIGGLIGYVLLMAFVARGNPQPGLPLLNGGAILGYIISAILTVGPEHVFQAITFL